MSGLKEFNIWVLLCECFPWRTWGKYRKMSLEGRGATTQDKKKITFSKVFYYYVLLIGYLCLFSPATSEVNVVDMLC